MAIREVCARRARKLRKRGIRCWFVRWTANGKCRYARPEDGYAYQLDILISQGPQEAERPDAPGHGGAEG